MNGFNLKFITIVSLAFVLVSCTEEPPLEDPSVKQEQKPAISAEEIIEDTTSRELAEQIVNEVELNLQPSEQDETAITPPSDQTESEETAQTEDSDPVEDEVVTSEAPDREEEAPASDTEVVATEPNDELPDAEQSTGTVEVQLTPKPREFDEFGRSVSDEQDFAAVVQRETIESDSQRIKEIEEKLVIYDPIDHPDKAGQTDVVSFALNTRHTPGTVLFRRNTLFFNRDKYLERCETYVDSEAAQQAFLDAGGPEVDDLNLDPDGDGFACSWNPEKYRIVLQ